MPEKPAHRWGIAILIGAAIAISYFDRQTLPVAINAIEREIPISNTQFSQLQAAFLTAYAIMYAGGGKLIDVLGVRAGFALIMAWWSLASASHALATGFRPLAASRFLLGMGRTNNRQKGVPLQPDVISQWVDLAARQCAHRLRAVSIWFEKACR